MAQLVKTISSVAIASCKTVDGLAIASVKTVTGVDNTSGGGSCPADGSPSIGNSTLSNDDEQIVTQTTDRYYYGQGRYSDASTRDICKVAFYIGAHNGTVTSKHFVAKIWTMTGDNLNAVITNGTSDQTTGGADGWYYFLWSGSKPTMTGGSTYAITMECVEGVDGTNNVVAWQDTPSSISGNKMVWSSAKVVDVDQTTYDCNIRLYWFA
jgi:hypothetical protein